VLSLKPNCVIIHPFLRFTIMKKLVLLAAGVATLALGSCNNQKCPAYSSTKEANRVSSPITASTATPAARQ
jgi:hypothetical protein